MNLQADSLAEPAPRATPSAQSLHAVCRNCGLATRLTRELALVIIAQHGGLSVCCQAEVTVEARP